MHHDRCKCVRKIFVKGKKELEYYQPGKVFRMKNVTAAYKVDNHENIDDLIQEDYNLD